MTPFSIRERGFHRQFEGVQRVARVAAGHVDQVGTRFRVQDDAGASRSRAPGRPGPVQDHAGLFAGQGQELEDARARDQRADDLEIRVFGGGADQHDRAVFDVGQERILLGLVPAVDLVHEEDGSFSGTAGGAPGRPR